MSVKLGNNDLGLLVKGIKEEQQKTITITQNGTTRVTPDTGKVLNEVEIITSTPVPKEEQSKSVTIISNKLTTITPDSGKVLSEVNVTTNIPSFIGIPKEVDASGKYGAPATAFEFTLPSNATDLKLYALHHAFYNCKSLTSVDLSSLTTISEVGALEYAFVSSTLTSVDLSSLTTISVSNALQYAFQYCQLLTSVDLSSLTTISGDSALQYAFYGCSALTSLSFPSLTTISKRYALQDAFQNCSALTSVDLSSLTTISGSSALNFAFSNCSALTSVDLSSLTTISAGEVLQYAFYNCSALTSLSFPSLTTNSFSYYNSQFNNMLSGVTGCTVHFPASIQSTIGSWSSVVNGFGGTNTTVLFDIIQKITVDGVEYTQDVLNDDYDGYKAFKNGTSTIYVDYTNEPAVGDTVYSDGGTTTVGTISAVA